MSLTISIPYTIITYDSPSSLISYQGLDKRLGGAKQAFRRSTPPKESKSSESRPDKTPSARAKVLPWVHGIETDDPPDGMFGPYPSRPQSMVDPPSSIPQTRHPFAYPSGPTLPFSALGSGRRGSDNQPIEYLASQRPVGDMMGPDVELGDSPHKSAMGDPMAGGDTPAGFSDTSPGMGTFGMGLEGTTNPAQVPLPNSHFANSAAPNPHKKTQYTKHKKLSGDLVSPGPLPPPKSHHSFREGQPAQTKPDSDEQIEQPEIHLHRPHHEHPFSHAETQAKQTEAMVEARAAALAQLEAAQNQQAELDIARRRAALLAEGVKGARQTYDTTTSVPSFGHIFHHDGMPLSTRPSMQIPPTGFDPFRIPFGVPLGMSIPRGMMVLSEGGLGVGLGLDEELLDIPEVPEPRRDDWSAFVETVEDEQDPTARTTSPAQARLKAPRSTGQSMQARTDSGLFGEPGSVDRTAYPSRQPTPSHERPNLIVPPGTRLSTAIPSNTAPVHVLKTRSAVSKPPTVLTENQTVITEPDRRTIITQVRTKNTPTVIPREIEEELPVAETTEPSVAPSHYDSIAPTTISNVKRMVAESRFHDETLCQLLDAARLNLIGEEAKKALQRAARARVIELRDLRGGAELSEPTAMPEPRSSNSTPKKNKRGKSKDRHRRRSGSEGRARSDNTALPQDRVAPKWAQDLLSHLNEIDARLDQIDGNREHPHKGINIPRALIDELIFHELPSSGFTNGVNMTHRPTSSILFPKATSQPHMPPTQSQYQSQHTQQAPTYVTQCDDKASTKHRSEPPGNDVTLGEPINWGSEVELPAAESVPQPKAATPFAPTINILAPTESNVEAGYKSTHGPSPSAARSGSVSRAATERMPDEVEIKVITEAPLPQPALPEPRERDLPPPPSESVRSHRPSPPPRSLSPKARTAVKVAAGSPSRTTIPVHTRASQYPDHSAYIHDPQNYHPPPIESVHGRGAPPSTRSVSAAQPVTVVPSQGTPLSRNATPPRQLQTPPRDVIHIIDPLFANTEGWKPWDRLQQRLYSWALIIEEKSLVKALEDVSLGRQVESFPLSIFLMMTYKRLIRRNLSETLPVPCDKLFVPPFMADNINVAVHHRNYDQAREILVELWESLGTKEPPRVIIALTKVRDDPDQWSAHRYDLLTNHLSTYKVSHLQDSGVDGRPFHWWQVIRQAWPEHQIPTMEELERSGTGEKIITTRVMPEHRHDNALYAANISRNLLLGYRPEREQDLTKLRELVWAEVKRLLAKKRQGKLMVVPGSPDHLYDT